MLKQKATKRMEQRKTRHAAQNQRAKRQAASARTKRE